MKFGGRISITLAGVAVLFGAAAPPDCQSAGQTKYRHAVAGELLRESRFYRQSRCASELALAFGTHPVAVKRSDPRNAL